MVCPGSPACHGVLFVLFLLFVQTGFLCVALWLFRNSLVDLTGLKGSDLPASASLVLRLKKCATVPAFAFLRAGIKGVRLLGVLQQGPLLGFQNGGTGTKAVEMDCLLD